MALVFEEGEIWKLEVGAFSQSRVFAESRVHGGPALP